MRTGEPYRSLRLENKRAAFTSDTLLLARFVRVKKGERVLELGVGSGAITLMLALELAAEFWGVELVPEILEEARRNLELNRERLKGTVSLVQGDMKEVERLIPGGGFDVVFCNPPYLPCNHTKSRNKLQRAYKFEERAEVEEILSAAARMLKTRGRFSLIYRPLRMVRLLTAAQRLGLVPKRLQPVYTQQRRPAKMFLLECIKGAKEGLELLPPTCPPR